MLIRVSVDEEAIVGYRQTTEAPDDGLELVLRAPLLLATAALSMDNKGLVCVTLATPTTIESLGGMQVAPGEARSPFQGYRLLPEGASHFYLECGCELGAQRLLDQLSAAGCVLQGLPKRYTLRKEVGRGGFGVVYLAHDTWSGHEVAVKVIHCGGNRKQIHPFREATLLRWAEDPLFPEFRAVYKIPSEELEELGLEEELFTDAIAIVTEYVSGGDVFSELARRGPLSEDAARTVTRQVLSGLDALDRLGVIHRDVKPENVLLGGENRVKLVDFGIACPCWDEEAAAERVGSVGYCAPEVLRQPALPQSPKADCFGAGALLYTCLAGHGPFLGESMKATLLNNVHNQVDLRALAAFPAGARDLLLQLLQTEPDQRPTAQRCLQHPWLAAPGQVAHADTESMATSGSDAPTSAGLSCWSSRSSLSSQMTPALSQHSRSTTLTTACSGTGPRAGLAGDACKDRAEAEADAPGGPPRPRRLPGRQSPLRRAWTRVALGQEAPKDEDSLAAQRGERRASSARGARRSGRQDCGGAADDPKAPAGRLSFRGIWHRVAHKIASHVDP